ncbi:hypothetical protein KQH26_00335 [bacterium]|nr:hypothetical protein [bacterium]
MENSNCENCKLRAKYDAKPKSLLGRFWKWHIGFCPGWRSYIDSLDEERRKEVLLKYARN